MECTNCGAPLDGGFRFCPECGTAVPDVRAGSGPPPRAALAAVVSLGGLTTALRIAMWAATAISALNAVAFATEPSLEAAQESAAATDGQAVVAVIVSLLSLAAPVLWVVWQSRSQRVLVTLGIRGLRFTPGWAAGWWLIPVANLVMPYRTVAELLHHSTGEAEPPPWFAAWWGSFLGSAVLMGIGSVLATSTVDTTVEQGMYAMAVGAASHVVSGFLGLRLIRRIHDGQRALVGVPA